MKFLKPNFCSPMRLVKDVDYGGAFRKYPLTLVRLKLTSVPLPSTPVNTQFHPAKIQVGN